MLLNIQDQHSTINSLKKDKNSFDYSYVPSTARIAIYDDLKSAPRIIEIPPATTTEYIESLSVNIYEQVKICGGTIPYTIIREVSENFIHAQFNEIIVSILDQGNTIRFADQGPGIEQKEKSKLPGFSSAVEPMKKYIRGVGSGLPIVKEYLDFSEGTINIEDNLNTGSVITISLTLKDTYSTQNQTDTSSPVNISDNNSVFPKQQDHQVLSNSLKNRENNQKYFAIQDNSLTPLIPPLTQRERDILPIFLTEGALGVTDLSKITGIPQSSTYVILKQLEQSGMVEKTVGQKRILTNLGYQVANFL